MFGSMWSPADLQPFHIGALFSIAVFVLTVLAAQALRAREAVRRRAVAPNLQAGRARSGISLREQEQQQVNRLIQRAAKLVAPSKHSEISAIRKQLVQAGYFSSSAVMVFSASRILLAGALPLLFLTFAGLLRIEIPGALIMVLAACFAMLGLIVPPIYLDYRTKHMREKYRRAFPDFMDLLVVCVESGQSLHSGIDRVSREIVEFCPELGANLHLVNLELRAGSTLTTALENLYGRLGIEEVQSLAVLLRQSEELGSSVATTLRIYSDEMRDKRLARAETKANSLPVKMTIPLGLFIFPVILLVILTPVVIRMKAAFM